jgi:hypothetical protein
VREEIQKAGYPMRNERKPRRDEISGHRETEAMERSHRAAMAGQRSTRTGENEAIATPQEPDFW